MTKTFKDEFDKIIHFIEKRGLATAFDNVIGLVNLDKMVDSLIPTPELRVDMHEYIRELLREMMKVEYPDEGEDETLIGYV